VQDGNEVDIFENKGIGFVKVVHSFSEFKFEIRSTKSETSTKVQNPNDQNKNVSNFEIWSFEFVSDFVLRISSFKAKVGST